ncbi:MAG: hypothetical protein GTO14_15830 [Anaerolineales bacterium]|nr:hypothetical protein [Anaerolineales bacterium]
MQLSTHRLWIVSIVLAAACQSSGKSEIVTSTKARARQDPSKTSPASTHVQPTHEIETMVPSASPMVMETSTPESIDACSTPSEYDLSALEIAFVADWDGDDEIYLVKADGNDLRQLTANEAIDVGPEWSPDGNRIAYAAGGPDNLKLYVIHPDGSGRRLLASNWPVDGVSLSWSSQGDKIAVASENDILSVSVEDDMVTNLTADVPFSAFFPTWSPNGDKLVFLGTIARLSYAMFIVNYDGTGYKMLNSELGEVWRPTWHPNKNKLLFTSRFEGSGEDIYLVDPEGTQLQALTDTGINKNDPTWSPNGEMIAYVSYIWGVSEAFDAPVLASLHVMNADGTNDTVIVQGPKGEEFIIVSFSWAPDNRHLAYIVKYEAKEEAQEDLYVLDICDRETVMIVEDVESYTPAWNPVP